MKSVQHCDSTTAVEQLAFNSSGNRRLATAGESGQKDGYRLLPVARFSLFSSDVVEVAFLLRVVFNTDVQFPCGHFLTAGVAIKNHSGRDRRIRDSIDQDQSARGTIVFVRIEADGFVQRQTATTNLIQFQMRCRTAVKRIHINAVTQRFDSPRD